MWLARDEDGSLYMYENKPVKHAVEWRGSCLTDMPQGMFPEVKWEDPEPTKVEIIIEKGDENQ